MRLMLMQTLSHTHILQIVACINRHSQNSNTETRTRTHRAAHELIEFVIDYVENIRERPVLPSVEPGYLQPLLPDKAPYLREPWAKIMPDIERYIMPGVSIISCECFDHKLRAQVLTRSATSDDHTHTYTH